MYGGWIAMRKMTVIRFLELFPDDDACLNYLLRTRFGGGRLKCPNCRRRRAFVRLTKRPAYICPSPGCGHHIYPAAGTPFAYSTTSLQKWFYAVYLLTISDDRLSAKELQRQLGVTYKCAWRMRREIRKYNSLVTPPPDTLQ
jgi:transposase